MFESNLRPVNIPDVSVFDFLFEDLSEQDSARIALVDPATGAETTYATLLSHIEAIAGALAARGVGTETVMGLLCPNVPAFVSVFHGALRAGATVTTINALYTGKEVTTQLRDANATWLMTISPFLPQAREAAAAQGISDDHLIVLDGAEGHPSLRDLLIEQRAAPDVTFDPATHLAVLPYSSGTTGLPKGVMLTHKNLVANVTQAQAMTDVSEDDRILAVLPFFHIYGMTVLLNLALSRRASLVPMPRFDLVQFLENIQNHKCTYLFIAPPIAVALAKHPLVDQYDISTVRMLFSGAAALDGATAKAAAARIKSDVKQGYGMSEMSPASHMIGFDDDVSPVSSIGALLPNMQCKLIDPLTGDEITEYGDDGHTAPGELWLRGPNVMLGYLGRPEETASSIDADGFLHTGDIATAHRDGYFTIVDRLKELIKYKGYQIAPAELEALLLQHPLIMDAAVIGVKDEDGEEIPKAFVVRAPDAVLSDADVIAFIAAEVAPHKKVRRVEFIDAIPKSSAGKILRKDLRSRETNS